MEGSCGVALIEEGGLEAFTRKLWDKQNQHVGDRQRLFQAVAHAIPQATTVLYPGSYVDVAPSFIWPSVTYVDLDRRAARFFGDREGVDELLNENGADQPSGPSISMS